MKRWPLVALVVWFGGFSRMAAGSEPTQSQPFVHPLFADNMVLPRDVAAPVWGWCAPGARVVVSLANQSVTGTADEQGRWLVKMGPFPAGGPYTLTVTGPQSATYSNVLVGDVWLCSGQSNMGLPVKNSERGEAEAAAADFPQIRLFAIQARPAGEPRSTFQEPVQWQAAGPATVSNFSAVAFYFGRHLHQNLKIPIGLIHASAGATTVEAWSSAAALLAIPGGERDLAGLAEWKELLIEWARYDAKPDEYRKLMAEWYLQNDPGSATEIGWADPILDDVAWKTMNLPGQWHAGGLPGFEGVVWFRKNFDLPEALHGKDGVIFLGPMDRCDTVWVNGTKIGQSDSNGWVRRYHVPGKLLKATGNLIAVRVLGSAGFLGTADQLKLVEAGNTPAAPALSLVGPWRYRESVALKKATRVPSLRSGNPSIPTALFNGAIAPLVPFAIKGALWYQGESNANNFNKYRQSLPALIKDWRARFGVGDFPFLIVQLPGFGDTHAEPAFSQWSQFREVQAAVARTVSNCGLAVTIDLGEAKNVHPHNKQEVARRLGLVAQTLVYGAKLESSGPVFNAIQVEGGAARLRFEHAAGLAARPGEQLQGFAIAGADKHFVWAEAMIENGEVVVHSPKVQNPVAIRYAWDDTPAANLMNNAGLPAAPFRTDAW